MSLLRLNDSYFSAGSLVILTQLLAECAAVKELHIRYKQTYHVHCLRDTRARVQKTPSAVLAEKEQPYIPLYWSEILYHCLI